MFEELKGKSIMVTGASGFIGSHLSLLLKKYEAKVYRLGYSNDENVDDVFDLRSEVGCEWAFSRHKIDYVFHLAGYNGGIMFNIENPASILHDNILMAMNVLESCKKHKVSKVVSTITSCGYGWEYSNQSKFGMLEECYQLGEVAFSVAPHGYAKRMLALASRYYHEQYGLNAVTVCPTTVYGPGDRFDETRSKVLSGLIYKFVNAKQRGDRAVTLYGTGKALREFIYVGDLAHLLILSLLKYEDNKIPLNLASGHEVSVAELAKMIAASVGYTGEIQWDVSKPDGQMRKLLNRDKQLALLGEVALTPLAEGIDLTVGWYLGEQTCN